MTSEMDITRIIDELAARRSVYSVEAYYFVLESLEQVAAAKDSPGHISGVDLLDGIRQLAGERYGVMAVDVFEAWGVHATIDFGRIVFHLVEADLLRKRERDTLADFIDRFDFAEAFALKACKGFG